MGDIADHIAGWQAAGLIDADTADRLLATLPEEDVTTGTSIAPPLPAGNSVSGVFGPAVHVSEAFAYLGIGFIAAAWSAYLASMAVGADEVVLLVGALLPAGVFAGMFLVLRRGDDRWRRGAGVAALVSTGYVATAAWIAVDLFAGVEVPTALVISALATMLVAIVFRLALPSLTTTFGVLVTTTTLSVTMLQYARETFFDNGASQLMASQGEALLQLVLEAAWWIVTAILFGLVALREAADPDDAPGMRRAGLIRSWAGLVLVIGVSTAVTRTVSDPALFEFRRILEPWVGDLIIIAVSLVLIERALRRGSGAFLVGGALGMIIALTDLNTSYLTDSIEAGLLIEGVILLSIGFAANRIRQRLDRAPDQMPDDVPDDEVPGVPDDALPSSRRRRPGRRHRKDQRARAAAHPSPAGRLTGPPPDHRAIIGRLADCIDFMRRGRRGRSSTKRSDRRSTGVDAQEIKTAVAHQDAARAAADVPFVNLADPAKVLGPDGKPAVSRRAPMWTDIPDEQWNDWRWQLSHRVNDLEEIEQVLELTDDEREGLSAPDKFRVDITPYFISLIDPKDPDDPIRRQVIPSANEHQAFTAMMEDSLAEDRHSPVPGLVHRYPDRVLMLVTTQCASYCRYCTRSRIVGDPTQNFNSRDHEAQLDYLRRTPQVRDVLISGGDGLTLAPKLFEKILRGLREIPHIEIIRIGSRVPVFLPQRIDDELCEMLAKYHPLWINLHFNHPNEITPEVSRAVDKLTKAGLPVGNQSVLLAGVNDCVHIQRAPGPQAGREPYPARTTCTSATSSRAPGTSGRRWARASRSWRAARPHLRLRGADVRHRRARAAAARSRSCRTT